MDNKGQQKDTQKSTAVAASKSADFVLSKQAFSSVFTKDIQKVFVYKKAERIAKAVLLVSPAFERTPALRRRAEAIALGILDAAMPGANAEALASELLALSGMLALARAGKLLSPMNADILEREAELLLAEAAGYDEPHLTLDEAPSLAKVMREVVAQEPP